MPREPVTKAKLIVSQQDRLLIATAAPKPNERLRHQSCAPVSRYRSATGK